MVNSGLGYRAVGMGYWDRSIPGLGDCVGTNRFIVETIGLRYRYIHIYITEKQDYQEVFANTMLKYSDAHSS